MRNGNFKMQRRVALDSLYIRQEMTSPTTSVGSKLHKRVQFGSFCGRDFSVMFQPISKRFTVLERAIQVRHSPLDTFGDATFSGSYQNMTQNKHVFAVSGRSEVVVEVLSGAYVQNFRSCIGVNL